ncbi:MAG: nickel insertion protein [Phycisphaeraceae bacterium]
MSDATRPNPTSASDRPPTEVVELAVNLDDVTPEVIAAATAALLAEGALDVWTVAIGMKKQRPGVMLCLLCAVDQRAALARRVVALTGSFGVRWRTWDRLVVDRRHVTLETAWGPVRVKVGELDGQVVVARPEYEDVRSLAARAGVDVREAMGAATAAAERWRAGACREPARQGGER